MIIYKKTGEELITIDEFTYSGIFMGERNVSATVKFHAPIAFAIGDYCSLRGDSFVIDKLPTLKKVASTDSYGHAYEYTLLLRSTSDELINCSFMDYVVGDNLIHYSNYNKQGFYGDLSSLAERIQVNLNRLYTGDKAWTIVVSPTFVSTMKVVKVQNINCWEALTLAYTVFGASFTITGRTITLGETGESILNVFKQGKDNGIVEIEKVADQDQRIITRLRAYGSTRNLPAGYNQGVGIYSESAYHPNLMIPNAAVAGVDYIDSERVAEYGIREGSVYFDGTNDSEEIYPSIEGMTAEQLIAAGVPVNATGRLDEVLSATAVTDAEQPSVEVVLKDLGFNLPDFLTSEAIISMQSGECSGSEFEIASCTKDGDTYKLVINVKDEGGYLVPNLDRNIKAGDRFVLLNIQMPEVYVKAAEVRVLNAAIAYLATVDHTNYTYIPKLDNNFLARFPEIAESLTEGKVFNFEDEDLGINGAIIIQTLTVKYGGQIPEYELTLSEKRTVSSIDRLKKDLENISSGSNVNINGFVQLLDSIYIRKDRADIVKGLLSFMKGMKSANYAPGFFGQGFSIQPMKDALGNILPSWEAVFEYLTVTKKATFKEIIIEQLSHVGGAILLSPAAIKCTSVENILDTDGVTVKAYRCFFDNSEVPNRFDLADQALCQDFSLSGSKRYWRYVIGIGEDYIDLSATDCEVGSDIPEAEDEIIQLGNRADPARQAAILLTSYGLGGPSFQMVTNVGVLFEGEVTPYTLENREEIRIKPNDSLFTGTVVIAGTDGKKYRVPRDRGAWTPGTIALYYDRYSYNGSLWLCLAIPSTDLEPNEENETAWLKQVAKGSDGSAGDYTSYVFIESDTQPATPTGTSPVPAGWLDAPSGVGTWWMSMATVNALTNQAGTWSTPIQITGEDGSVFPYRYAKNTSKTEYPPIVRTDVEPAGWSTTPPALSPGEYLWMTQAEIRFKTVASTGNVFDITFDDTFYTPATEVATTKTATLLSNWTEPVRISGEAGQDGQDGKSIEFIFRRTTEQVAPATPDSVNEDDYVPLNWTDNQTGVDGTYKFEYVSKRVRSITGVWGDFSVPALWAKYSFDGQNGRDGADYEFIFTRTATDTTPQTPATSQTDDFVPAGWTDDPAGVDSTWIYEWVSKRVKVNGIWGAFSAPAKWSNFAFDGTPGADGSAGLPAILAALTNDYHIVPALHDGTGQDYTGATTTLKLYVGGVEQTTGVTYNFIGEAGVGFTVNGNTITITSLTVASATITCRATYAGVNYDRIFKVVMLKRAADGTNGVDGVDGATLYTWVKYADDASGTGLSDNPTGKSYIGLAYNKTTATEGTNPADYTWSLIKGADGINGTDGTDGINGTTYYTWIKYADNASGSGISDDPTGKTYIGFAYNKTTAVESNTPSDYTWSLIKGADGADGTDGANGITYYTWIKYATDATGTGLSDDPTGKTHIGIAYNKTTSVESLVASDYTWSLIKGTDGINGTNGVDGITHYTWIKYSDYSDGTSLYDTPTANTLYIGIATNKTTAAESTNKADYTWSKFKGDTGVAGPSLYTWIKYSDYADGTSLYDTPTANTLYIGIAVNKTSATESTTKTDYVWSKFKGDAGVAGADGVRYWVINGQSVIVKNGTTFTPSTLWFYPRKQIGAAAPVAAAGCSFKIIGYKPNDATEYVVLGPTVISSEMSFSLTVTSTYVSYKAQLILSSVVLDEQRIYMTEDAKSAQDNISAAIGYADFNDFLAHAAQTHIVQGNGKINSALIESEVIITDAVMAKKIAELAGARITQEVAVFTQKNGLAIQSTIGGNETSVSIRPDSLQDKASFLASVSLSGQTNLPALSDSAWNPTVVKTNVATSYQTIPTGVNAVKWNSIPLVASISVNSRNAADLERGVGLAISLYARFQQDSTLLTETLLGTVSGSSGTDSYSLSASVAAGQAAVPGGANRVYLVARYFASGNFNAAFPMPTCTISFTANSLASYFTNGTGIRKTQISPDGIAVALDANNYLHVKAGTTKMLLSYMGDIESNSIAQKLLTMSIAASGLIVNVGGYMKKAGFTVGSSVTKVSTGVWRIQHDIYSNYGLGPSSYTVHPVVANAGYDIPAYMYVSASDTTSYNWTEVRAINHQGVLVDTEFYLTFMRI